MLSEVARARAEALERQLSARCTLVPRSFDLAGERIELLSIDDVDPLLLELEELERTDPDAAVDRLPFWASLWPSSVALARYLVQRYETLEGVRALELGCGAGLVSLTARLLGASVVSTDHLGSALRLAELNFLKSGREDFHGRPLDWRAPPAGLSADLVLASDVAYERELFTPLADTLARVTVSGGRVLLAEPRRPVARHLLELLEARGWRSATTAVTARLDARETEVDVHELTR